MVDELVHCDPIPPAVPIQLTGLLHEDGQLFAVFTAGNAERIIDAELRDVIPFDNFRRLVLDRFGVRVVYKSGHWFRDVLAAAERGGVTIEVDHLAQAIWVNEHSVPFAEAGYLAELMLSPAIYAEAGPGVGKFIDDVLVHMAKSVVDLIQEMTNLAAISFFGLQAMVVEFRSSIAGKAMGVDYGSEGKELLSRGGLLKSYDNVEAYINRPKWSAGIDKMVEAATAAAAKAVKDATSADAVGRVMGWAGMASGAAKGVAASMYRKEKIPFNELAYDREDGNVGGVSKNWMDYQNSTSGMADGFYGWLEKKGIAATTDKFDPFYKLGELMSKGPGQMQVLLGGFATQAMGMIGGLGNKLKAQGQRPALSFAESGSVDSYRQQAAIRKQSGDIAKRQLTVQQKMESHLAKIASQPPLAVARLG